MLSSPSHASGLAVAGSTPGSEAARVGDVEKGGGGATQNRKPAPQLGGDFCGYRMVSPCSSTNGTAVVWTAGGLGLCGKHMEMMHRWQIEGRAVAA